MCAIRCDSESSRCCLALGDVEDDRACCHDLAVLAKNRQEARQPAAVERRLVECVLVDFQIQDGLT
jgi:hypothetical protein